jgi:hypothetical protein
MVRCMKLNEFSLTALRVVIIISQLYVFYRLKDSLSSESFGVLVQQIYLMLIVATILRFGFSGFSQNFKKHFAIEKLAHKYASIIYTYAIITQILLLPVMLYFRGYEIIFLFGVVAANITFSLLKRLEGDFLRMIFLDYNVNYVVIALLHTVLSPSILSVEFVFKIIFLCEFVKLLYLLCYYKAKLFAHPYRSAKVLAFMIKNRKKNLFLFNDVLSMLSQNGLFALLPLITGAAIAGQYFWITRFVFPLQFWQQTLNTIWVRKLRVRASLEIDLKLYLSGIFIYSKRGFILCVLIFSMCYFFDGFLLIEGNLTAVAFLILLTLPSLLSGPSGPFLNKLGLPYRLVFANLLYILTATMGLFIISLQFVELWQLVFVLGSANVIKNFFLTRSVVERLKYDKYI